MPLATLEAFDDHGDPRLRPLRDDAEADAGVEVLFAAGIDLDRITDDLERDGVAKSARSYTELTACIEDKLQAQTR